MWVFWGFGIFRFFDFVGLTLLFLKAPYANKGYGMFSGKTSKLIFLMTRLIRARLVDLVTDGFIYVKYRHLSSSM